MKQESLEAPAVPTMYDSLVQISYPAALQIRINQVYAFVLCSFVSFISPHLVCISTKNVSAVHIYMQYSCTTCSMKQKLTLIFTISYNSLTAVHNLFHVLSLLRYIFFAHS